MENEGTWTIGNVVKMLRDEQEIIGPQLSYGLCSKTTLSRIENNEREMNMIFAMVLFGRLGYHPDKYELYGSTDEYIQYEQRESMQKLKKLKDCQQLEMELAEYEKSWKKDIEEDVLQQQFVDTMKGFLCLQKGKYLQSVELLKKAVSFTIPEWEGEWLEKAVVGADELEIMEILADALEASGECEKAFEVRTNIFSYLKKKPTSRRQMIEIYTLTISKIVPVMLEQKNIGQALELCDDGLNALSEGGRMFQWPELLYGRDDVWKNYIMLEK